MSQQSGHGLSKDIAPEVQYKLDGLSQRHAGKLLQVRRLIDQVAKQHRLGPIVETTKWDQIAYLPAKPNIGSTVRLSVSDDYLTLFVHCQTTLVSEFKALAARKLEDVFCNGSARGFDPL